MKILLDTNVVLDVLCDREPFAADAAAVWKLCETRQVSGFLSALSVPNIVYIMRKELSPERTEQILRFLLMIFDLSALNADDLKKAAALRWADFEDALQSVTAEKENASCIVTRNKKNFADSPVPAVTPAEFLALLQKNGMKR